VVSGFSFDFTSLPMSAVVNAQVGRSVASVTRCVSVRTVKEKRLELSAPNLVDMQCMAVVARHALNLRSKGQGHMVIKYAASMGMQIDMTALFSRWERHPACETSVLLKAPLHDKQKEKMKDRHLHGCREKQLLKLRL